jgi:hypothetical protein
MSKKITVLYEYHEGEFVPMKYLIYFGAGGIDWGKHKTVYIPVEAPFQLQQLDDFPSDIVSFSISFDELLRHPEKPNSFGIDLALIRRRVEKKGGDVWSIEQFVLLVSDIEEVMQMTLLSERIRQVYREKYAKVV